MKSRIAAIRLSWLLMLTIGATGTGTQVARVTQGIYRLPFADGTEVRVFDDFNTHRPVGRTDLYAIGRHPPIESLPLQLDKS
jgi:hypothetical protein